jgi:hypothetical protein
LAREPGVLSIIALRILIIFVESSMSSTRLINYYQNRFGIATSQLGFVSTISNIVGVLIQTLLVNRIINYCGGNGSIVLGCLVAIGLFHMVESLCPTYLYFAFCSLLPGQIAGSLMSASIRNLFSSTVPTQHFGKASAVFSMLISVSGIVSPLYGSHVYSLLATDQYHYKGIISGVHMLALAAGVSFLLPSVLRASKDKDKTHPHEAAISLSVTSFDEMGDDKQIGVDVVDDGDMDELFASDAGARAAADKGKDADTEKDKDAGGDGDNDAAVKEDGLRRRKNAATTTTIRVPRNSAATDADADADAVTAATR